MKRAFIRITTLVTPMLLAACASAPPAPPPAPMPQSLAAPAPEAPATPILASSGAATQPAGPSDFESIIAQRAQKKAKMSGELPAGHPPVGGMPQLPKGHPDISQMQGARAASTKPAKGASLTVRAVQSTPGGPQIGELPVTLELRQDTQVIEKRELKLGPDGTLHMDEIPVNLSATPVVRVNYQGVEYTAAGEVLDDKNADQQIQVAVYETTETAPAWSLSMQHVMLEPSSDGVQVTEMLVVSNPADRAWIGKLGPDNKRTTLTLPIPPNATEVQLAGGFHECCVKVGDGKIVDSMALLPGTSQYRISYTLPVNAGNADLALTTPATVKQFMLFLPDDGSQVAAEGIGSPGVADMGGGKTRYFKASDLAAGANIKLNISGITATPTAAGKSSAGRTAASANAAKLVAGIGGLAIFVVGGMLVMFKAPRAKKA